MDERFLKRCLTSISKWYFIEFYLLFYSKTLQQQNELIIDKELLWSVMYEHYDIVKRTLHINPVGFMYRFNRMRTLLLSDAMDEALMYIMIKGGRRVLRSRAQEVYTQVHGAPFNQPL